MKGEKMNCIKCGANLTEGDKFCPNCGTPVQRNNINNIESKIGLEKKILVQLRSQKKYLLSKMFI